MSAAERDRLAQEVLDEVFGLGPLEPLLHDPTISDILVNTCSAVYIERHGKLEKTSRHVQGQSVTCCTSSRRSWRGWAGASMSLRRWWTRGLKDGSRVNVIIPPLAVDGPIVSIRRFGSKPLTAEDLVQNGMLTAPMLDLLRGAVQARRNIIVSGGTGAGKTTLLNVLSGFISERERIVTIEDSAELQMKQEHVVRLETRPPNVEGHGAVRQRELVINALRMRPDRVVLGEVRGEECLDMLQAMNTGHDGSITTIHANTPRDALARLETMAMMSEVRLAEKAVRSQIASAVHVIVQVARLSDGTRRITHITELTGAFSDVVSLQDIFVFERQGLGPEGVVRGCFRATGVLPKLMETLQLAGISLGTDLHASAAA